jgi:hypothetical protein
MQLTRKCRSIEGQTFLKILHYLELLVAEPRVHTVMYEFVIGSGVKKLSDAMNRAGIIRKRK